MVREMRTPYMHSTVGLPRPWGDGSTSELGPDRVGTPSSALSSSTGSLSLSRAVRRSLIKAHQVRGSLTKLPTTVDAHPLV
jgi:hypothetical protein